MTRSIGIHFFEFKDMFRCLGDIENLKKHFGHMYTLRKSLCLSLNCWQRKFVIELEQRQRDIQRKLFMEQYLVSDAMCI